jgi:hypothetical protein
MGCGEVGIKSALWSRRPVGTKCRRSNTISFRLATSAAELRGRARMGRRMGSACRTAYTTVMAVLVAPIGGGRSVVPFDSVASAARRRRLHHHYVICCRPPWIGRISRLLRHKGGRTPVREGGRDGMRGRSRWNTGQHSSSRCHRHADLDEAIRVRRAQRADRPERGGQSRGAARQGWTGSGHREWRAVPRLRRLQLHDRGGTRDRWRDDGRRKASLELTLTAQSCSKQALMRVSRHCSEYPDHFFCAQIVNAFLWRLRSTR